MKTKPASPFLTERLYSAIFHFLREYRIPFLAALIFGFCAHMFTFTNKLLNHDELNFLFSKGITISSGRWGLVFLEPFLPDCSLPWLNGIITIFLIAVSVCLLIRLFSIKNTLLQIILSGLVISFPSLTGTFSYMFTSAYYGIAFLLAVASVCLIHHTRTKRRYIYVLTALIFSIFSTAIYQSYIAITASLFVLLLIRSLLDPDSDIKKLTINGFCSVAFLALSLGGYWICCKLIWFVTDIPMNQYSQEALTFQFSNILDGIKNAYQYFFSHTLHPSSGLMVSSLSRYFHIGCMILACTEFLVWAGQSRSWSRILLMIFLLAMLPLSINCMYIFIAAYHIHTLVLYSFVTFYIFVAIMIEHLLPSLFDKNLISRLRKYACDIIIAGLSVVLVSNIYTSNTAYLNLFLRYENFYAFCTSTISALQNIPGYQSDTPVAIVGTYQEPDFYADSFSRTENLTGFNDFSPNSYSKGKMFEYYMGQPLNLVHDGDAELLSQTAAVLDMPEYPSNGYVQMIDGTVVIKLSE